MAYSLVPTESKKEINKAGEFLSELVNNKKKKGRFPTSFLREFNGAWDLASRWRNCHDYPINTFQATLRNKIKKQGFSSKVMVAQRLKRMPTIINKLGRYPQIPLTSLQDIAGVRAVLPSVIEAEKLAEEYKTTRFLHELERERNYVVNPRDADGYRSIHLIYRYKNKNQPAYDDLQVEVQIRSQLQHIWATAVETIGMLLSQGLKYRQGSREWLNFFAIISSAFAHIEDRPPLPRFSHFSRDQTYLKVVDAESNLNALQTMKGISFVVPEIITGRGHFYHLVVFNHSQKSISLTRYTRDSWREATAAYSKAEAEARDEERRQEVKKDVFLLSAGRIKDLKIAYPNVFTDIRDFIKHVEKIKKWVGQ